MAELDAQDRDDLRKKILRAAERYDIDVNENSNVKQPVAR